MRRAAPVLCLLLLSACRDPSAGVSGGLVLSDTSTPEYGPPPECDDETGGAGETEAAADEAPALAEGTKTCAAIESGPACDGLEVEGGTCRWVDVVPVLPGTCDVTSLYRACVFVPAVASCVPEAECGQVGLGVYGREGCDGTFEIFMVSSGDGFCGPPADWPLCAGDDPRPECSCACV